VRSDSSESEKWILPAGEPGKDSALGSRELECSTKEACAAAARGGRGRNLGLSSSASTASTQERRDGEPRSIPRGCGFGGGRRRPGVVGGGAWVATAAASGVTCQRRNVDHQSNNSHNKSGNNIFCHGLSAKRTMFVINALTFGINAALGVSRVNGANNRTGNFKP
jgi:hypothetical protein